MKTRFRIALLPGKLAILSSWLNGRSGISGRAEGVGDFGDLGFE